MLCMAISTCIICHQLLLKKKKKKEKSQSEFQNKTECLSRTAVVKPWKAFTVTIFRHINFGASCPYHVHCMISR